MQFIVPVHVTEWKKLGSFIYLFIYLVWYTYIMNFRLICLNNELYIYITHFICLYNEFML